MSAAARMRSIDDLEVAGRRVFLRADLNVPLRAGAIADDSRLRASRETLSILRERGARVVLASHLGRPAGRADPRLSLAPVAQALDLPLSSDCVGTEAERAVSQLADGGAVLLENLRFHPGEESNDPDFAAALARLADVYVNDAFGTAHRAHASTEGLAHLLAARAAGRLMQREVEILGRLRDAPARPYLCVLGGAKVGEKLAVLEALAARADTMCVGGAMAYTFLLAQGKGVGRSLVEPDLVANARRLLDGPTEIVLPVDHIVAEDPEHAESAETVDEIPEGKMALDIGPRSVAQIAARLTAAATVFWNGPLGLFETPPFDAGSRAVAEACANASAFSVVGGGDTLAAVRAAGVAERISHLSTGGGAALEFLEGRTLPGVAVLEEDA